MRAWTRSGHVPIVQRERRVLDTLDEYVAAGGDPDAVAELPVVVRIGKHVAVHGRTGGHPAADAHPVAVLKGQLHELSLRMLDLQAVDASRDGGNEQNGSDERRAPGAAGARLRLPVQLRVPRASASVHVMLSTANKSMTQKIRDVCNCTASARWLAMKGSDARNVTVRRQTPATIPASHGAASRCRVRHRHTATTTTGNTRLANHAPAGQAVGKT